MSLIATVFARHLGELELGAAELQMRERLRTLGLPVPENALAVWEACRRSYSAAERLHGGVATLEEIEAENVAMRAECDQLRAEIARIQAVVAERNAEADRIRAEIAERKAEIERLRSIQAEMASTQQRIAELEKKQEEDVHKRAAAMIVRFGIRNPSKAETETPKNHHAPHQEN